MAEYLIQSETLDDIADAINAKTGGSSAMTPAQMVTEIGSIQTGGGLGDFELANTIEVTEPVTQLSISVPEWAKELYVQFSTTDSASNKPSIYHTSVANSRLLCMLNTAASHTENLVVFWIGLDNNNFGTIACAARTENQAGNANGYGKPSNILYVAGSSATFTGTFAVYARR